MLQNQKLTEARSWLSLFLAHLGWVAMILGVVTVLLTAASVAEYLQGSAFDRKGVATEARVLSVRPTSTGHLMTLSYSVPEGNFAGKMPVADWYVARYRVGSIVEVYYMPHSPAVISRTARIDRSGGIFLQVSAGIAGIVGLAMTLFAGLKANEAVRARRYAHLIRAEVTRIAHYQPRDGTTPVTGHIVFLDEEGRFGKSFERPLSFLEGWQIGALIDVYKAPHRSWWIEDIGPREDVTRVLPHVRP